MASNETKQPRLGSSAILNVAAFVIVTAGVMYADTMVKAFLLSIFIAIIVSQPITWMQKRKIPQGLAITAMFLLIIAVIGILGGVISSSFSSFSEDLPKYEQNLYQMTHGGAEFLQKQGVQLNRDELFNSFDPSQIMSTMTGFLSDFGDVMGNSFTILFLTLFLIIEQDTIPLKLKTIARERGKFAYLETIGHSIRHYLSIKTITSALTAVFIWISLLIVGVDYALIWAVIAFLLNYIPNIGSIIAAVPAVLFALVQLGVGGAIWTTAIFVVANMVVGNVIEPRMMGKGLGLSTYVVFLSLIFWGFILGTVGMFLSVPLTMACKIAFEQNPNTRWAAVLLGTEEDAKNAAQLDKQDTETQA